MSFHFRKEMQLLKTFIVRNIYIFDDVIIYNTDNDSQWDATLTESGFPGIEKKIRFNPYSLHCTFPMRTNKKRGKRKMPLC